MDAYYLCIEVFILKYYKELWWEISLTIKWFLVYNNFMKQRRFRRYVYLRSAFFVTFGQGVLKLRLGSILNNRGVILCKLQILFL